MDMQRYRKDHAWILRQFQLMRELSRSGVREHAKEISGLIRETAARIKVHLAAEESLLYPALAHSGDPRVAALGERYQREMHGMAQTFIRFVKQWSVPANLANDPEGFRADANAVLKALFERVKRENAELYPAAEKAGRSAMRSPH